MQPITGRRRRATRFTTSRPLTILALAAGLSLAPLAGALAQHEGHQGHHHGEAAKPAPEKAPDRKAPRQRRSSSPDHAEHAGHAASAGDTPAVSEFKAAHARMMRGMAVPYTGDPDADFRIQMIPHHQGAIDMARVALRRARDPWTRQLAESVIIEQQREIAEMQAWLARHGRAAPSADGSLYTITASSFPKHDEEAGTLDESRGQSWAPGSGVPARP